MSIFDLAVHYELVGLSSSLSGQHEDAVTVTECGRATALDASCVG